MEKKGIVGLIAAVVFCIVVAVVIYSAYKEKHSLCTDVAELSDYYDIADDEMLVFENGRQNDERLPYLDGQVYLKLEYVQGLNDRYYWDETLDCLIFTTESEIQLIKTGEKGYTVEDGFADDEAGNDGTAVTSDYIILREIDGTKYIALDFVKDNLDISYSIYYNPNRMVLYSKWGEYLYAEVTEDTQLRVGGSIKSAVLRELKAGTKLDLTDSNGSNRSGFLLVTTEDGVRAYVDEKYISESYYETFESTYTEKEYSHISMDCAVNLAWDVTVSTKTNSNMKSLMKNVTGVNVISPTWFNISDAEGNIENRATTDYVETAHNMGLQVWALVANFSPATGSLDIDETALLSGRRTRAALIKNLIDAANEFGLDGLNIDFENVQLATGPHYVQFLRELSIACRHEGLVLSIDDYPPYNYNAYYDIEEQGKIADYVIIMAYDEHTSAQDAGSVSSLTYVQEAIDNTLAKVDKERVIIGVPFYTRIWSETQQTDGMYRTTKAVSMTEAAKFVKENGMVANWLNDEAQYFYYAEITGVTYRIWMEDTTSIQAKCIAIMDAGVAGIAEWRLGQEDSAVWEIISSYIK